MQLQEAEFDLRVDFGARDVFERLDAIPQLGGSKDSVPIRFVVSGRGSAQSSRCEVGTLSGLAGSRYARPDSIFRFRRRPYENQGQFNVVFLVPTGIGADIGGHAGDATPAARMLAAVCDRLVVHPNVVNAADINEMTANMLYVEGSVVSRLLMGTAGLCPVRRNRILTVIHLHEEDIIVHNAINAVNAARAAGGFACSEIVAVSQQMEMKAQYAGSGRAAGTVSRFDLLCDVVAEHRKSCDAVAISTVIDVSRELHDIYFDAPKAVNAESRGIVNPWGGIEALLTHGLSSLFDIPTAHSPMYEDVELMNSDADVMEPAKAAEGISVAFLHCILKGLSVSPQIFTDPTLFGRSGVLSAEDLSCLVVPSGSLGLPVLAALHQGIPVIEVKDRNNLLSNTLQNLPWADRQFFQAENYFEAAGILAALRAGVAHETVQRPLGLARGSDVLQAEKRKHGLDRRMG
jgi:hypothetical protein